MEHCVLIMRSESCGWNMDKYEIDRISEYKISYQNIERDA